MRSKSMILTEKDMNHGDHIYVKRKGYSILIIEYMPEKELSFIIKEQGRRKKIRKSEKLQWNPLRSI